jgi:hypothetical protein
MSERVTGATDAQIEAAHADYSEPPNCGVRYRVFDFQQIAHYLIPPDHRIIGPEDIAELRERSIALAVIRLGEHGPTATITETVDATIDALIGEQQ